MRKKKAILTEVMVADSCWQSPWKKEQDEKSSRATSSSGHLAVVGR